MSYNEGFTTDVLRELKITRLPVEGLPRQTVLTRRGFVEVFVAPLPPAPRRFALRLMCACPRCDKEMAVGRLVQHSKFCKR